MARVLQVFLSSTGACRTTLFGSHASSAHPQFMRTPLLERSGLRTDRILLYTAQAMLGSSSLLFHLPSGPLRAAVQTSTTTASISESGRHGSGSCREAVREVEKEVMTELQGKFDHLECLIACSSGPYCATSTHSCCEVTALWNATCCYPAID